ncbi:MAG: CehA/McbA family metallohydrolase [Armatimonadota bacterium]
MRPFFETGSRRAITTELVTAIEEATGSTPVNGFERMVDQGDAQFADARYSGFAENWDHREWQINLSDKTGLMWQTASVQFGKSPNVSFLLNIGFGNGSPLPQPSGRWDITVNGRFALSVRMVNHSQLWRGEGCSFAFAANRIETAAPYLSLCLSSLIQNESVAAFGPALLTVPCSWLDEGQHAQIEVSAICDVESTRWFQISPFAGMMQGSDIWQAVELLKSGARHQIAGYELYFGDIHTHSGQVDDVVSDRGCGMGSRRDNYEYARGAGGLDFYALTDHEYQIHPEKIDGYLGLADEYNEDGRFVCLPAFEYTNLLYGHRNVYFRASGGTVYNTNNKWGPPTLDPELCNTPYDLWEAMEKTGVPFITVPHHPSSASHPLNLDIYNPKYDRLYEVYSSWGSSEYYGDSPRGVADRFRTGDYQDAMRRGQRYGAIASADGHDGHPGDAQSPLMKHHHLFHFCGSGRAAVLSQELTRGSIFDALHARRCYATTGVPIVLDVRVNGELMGTELETPSAGTVPQIRIECQGTNSIDHVRVVKNGQVVYTHPCHHEHTCTLEWEDRDYDRNVPSSYYVRVVQKDLESAWSSPVWIG